MQYKYKEIKSQQFVINYEPKSTRSPLGDTAHNPSEISKNSGSRKYIPLNILNMPKYAFKKF